MRTHKERYFDILAGVGFITYCSLEGDEFFEKEGIVIKRPIRVHQLEAYYGDRLLITAEPYEDFTTIYSVVQETHYHAWKKLKEHERNEKA